MLWWYGHPATFLPDTVKKVRPQFPSWTGRRSRKKGKPGTHALRKKGESMVQERVECEIHKWNGQSPSRLSFGALRLLLSFIEWKKKKKREKDEANKMKEKEGCVECNFTGRHADVCCFPRGCFPCCFSPVASFSPCLTIASRFREFYL